MKTFHSYKFSLLTVTFLLLVVSGCGDRLPTGPAGSVIMPLAKGNMWIGRLTRYSEDGTVASTTSDTVKITEAIPWSENGEDALWYFSEASGVDFLTMLCRNTDEGLMVYSCFGVVAPYPAAPLDTSSTLRGEVLIPNSDDPNNPFTAELVTATRVEDVDRNVVVPSGSYKAYVYREKILEPDSVKFTGDIPWKYFVPDVGPVLVEWYQGGSPETGRMTKKWELVELQLH
ncbi:MAG: hypothetical protein KDD67_01510 [Ignavibacteriae bacterium]|nr:hypothetical protein [Ignavibacteriota bacterium]MCB9215505.1 hypothetical protein [Ignavibacteria bacterium]